MMAIFSEVHKIRPAGKHLLTVGRDLIQDKYAAIIELVKNAYDADALTVNIKFTVLKNPDRIIITIEDDGHGMSRDTVINKWLVPSTDDKLKRKISPKGRVMQGRKGVGRYATAILGSDILMETVTRDGEKTTVFLEWEAFETAKYLDDVEVLVDSNTTTETSGTILTISAIDDAYDAWDNDEANKLEYELKKLISPVDQEAAKNTKIIEFSIILEYENFWENSEYNTKKTIEPFPIFDLYDYRICGNVTKDGVGKFVFYNQKARNTEIESIDYFYIPESLKDNREKKDYYKTECGELEFDIRVYDRDKEAIEQLINRGLKDDHGQYVGKLEAKRMLNKNNGIGVYRNGFRIRPLGDPEYDWLKLNKKRIQNPSQKIGTDQVIGYVLIQSEEASNLNEKSARDGLRENIAYNNLQEISQQVIALLENRRFAFRKKTGLGRTAVKIEQELQKLFSYDDVKYEIRKTLGEKNVDNKVTEDVIIIVEKKEEENNKIVDSIRSQVAKYQGQATLGKIIDVVMHESGRSLSFFKNNVPLLKAWYNKYLESGDEKFIQKILEKTKDFESNSDLLVALFEKLSPLSGGNRGSKKKFLLSKAINTSIEMFSHLIREHSINVRVTSPNDLYFTGYETDIYQIMANIIDNSIYWLARTSKQDKSISIEVFTENGELSHIDIKDTGPGIEKYIIQSHVLFEPDFSTKTGGTGIGLAIAGEAALRNDLELVVFESDKGAYFRIQNKEQE